RTPVIIISPNPAKAILVTLSCSLSAKIQPVTISTKAIAVIRSSRDSGPNSASALFAAAGASGVAPTPGGNKRASNHGKRRIAVNAGTDAAMSHFPKPRLTPYSCATRNAIGLGDVAVIQSAEEAARLALPQNIK